MSRNIRIAIAILLVAVGVASVAPGLPWSAYSRHGLNKSVGRIKLAAVSLLGGKSRLISITGQTTAPGARVQAVDSKSGWATLCDAQGNFILPDVEWYPGVSYDLIVSTDEDKGRVVEVGDSTLIDSSPLIDVGRLEIDRQPEIDLVDLPGDSSYNYQYYDLQNRDYYRNLYEQLTSGIVSDADKVAAVNEYVSTRLSYKETEWEIGSPRRVLERGSQYCGHLSAALATLLAVAFPVRIIQLTDGSTPPNTHVVVEVKYNKSWHLYDPTFGLEFMKRDGTVASYKDVRLDPEQFIAGAAIRPVSGFEPLLMTRIYRTGYHHFYYLAYPCSQIAHAWWAYENGLHYLKRGGRILFAAAGVRPGTNVTYHIRKPDAESDSLILCSKRGAGSNCVLEEEESPPIDLEPGQYDVSVDLCDGNISDRDRSSPTLILNWHLAVKLRVE